MTNMNSARLTGALILISTSSYMTASNLIGPVFGHSDFIGQLSSHGHMLSLVTLLEFVNSAALILAAIVMYPIIRQFSERVAMTYIAFRIVEGVLLLSGAVLILSIVDMGDAVINGQTENTELLKRLTIALMRERFNYFQMGMLALSLAGFTLSLVFYQHRLIPRILSGLGMLGYAILLLKVILNMFDLDAGGQLLFIPGAIFELLLPFWLFFRGFNTPEARDV